MKNKNCQSVFSLRLGLLVVLALLLGSLPLAYAQPNVPPPSAMAPEPVAATMALPPGVSTDWWTAVQENIRQSEYHVTWQDHTYLSGVEAAYQSPNRAHNLRTYFTPEGPVVIPRIWPEGIETPPWHWGLRLAGRGREGALHPAGAATLQANANRIEYRRGTLVEWYVNDERGLEQGFTISVPPAPLSSAPLLLELALTGDLTPRLSDDGNAIKFTTVDGASALHYSDLYAVDATGRELAAWFALRDSRLAILVDDTAAIYPITIDPLATTPDWTAGANQQDYLGKSVGTAGDVNGDGYSDIIVGAPYYDNGTAFEGGVFVWYGSETGLGAEGTPTNADWVAESNQESARFGESVGTAGDVNGDGFSDVIVGAPGAYCDNEGDVFVWYGSGTGLGSSGTPDNADWSAQGDQGCALFGASVSTAGDVNGDGYSDIVVGAYKYSHNQTTEGAAFVWYGAAAPKGLGDPGTPTNADWTAESNQEDSQFGRSVGTAGDVNGDGYSDVIIGAKAYTDGQDEEGAAFVWYGSAEPTGLGPSGIPNNADWSAQGGQSDAYLGYSVATAGDVNGDGYSDIIVGAYGYDGISDTDNGWGFVWQGSEGGLEDPGIPMINDDWHNSGTTDDWFGYSVSTAGDIDGDGYSDVIVGAFHYTNDEFNEGQALAYYGSGLGLSTSAGWSVEGDETNFLFGCSVATAGDVNGDGYSDVIVGGYGYGAYSGKAFVYQGSASSPDPSNSGQQTGRSFWGDQSGANFSYSVGTAGDVNGDGYADIIVGAYKYDNGQGDEGRAFVWYGPGSISPDWTAESNQDNAYFGYSVSTAGDVNGDGYADIIVGAYKYDNGQTDEGSAFVWNGSGAGLGANGTPANADWTAEGDQESAQFGYSVGTAGNVNGDGYSDVIVGANWYDSGETNEGAAFAWHGSGSGLGVDGTPTNADWSAESDQDHAHFGHSVSTAGDVNGDGYSDVIVGAPFWNDVYAGEGGAWVYHGSDTGLNTASAWYKRSNNNGSWFGHSVGTAGDVNGDGYAEVIVGAPYWSSGKTNEGAAFVYPGSGSGLNLVPAWHKVSNQTDALFGYSVGTAGDVNGDGYAEVIVGAPLWTGSQTNEGGAWLYYGTAAGLHTVPDWHTTGGQASARLGYSVGTAGDVNGDGYADVIVGAHKATYQTFEGRARVYYGNQGGRGLKPRQRRHDDSAPIAPLGKSEGDAFRLAVLGRTPYSRGKVKLEWEVKPLGTPFDGTGTQQSAVWMDTGTAGVEFGELVSGLSTNTAYHWRLRLCYHPATTPFQQYSRWLTVPWNGWQEQDLRTGSMSVTLVMFSSVAYEVNENAGTATITVNLDGASEETVTVEYATSDGTASAGADYTAASDTLTFNPGVTSQTFAVPILDDGLDEPDETIALALSNPTNATIGNPAAATLTIIDDDGAPTVRFGSATYNVDEDAGSATITVNLSNDHSSVVDVNYATSNGTAAESSDYTAANGTLTFNPGVTSQTFNVPILDDGLYEGNETVALNLSDPTNATIGGTNPATLTILDNDDPLYRIHLPIVARGHQ